MELKTCRHVVLVDCRSRQAAYYTNVIVHLAPATQPHNDGGLRLWPSWHRRFNEVLPPLGHCSGFLWILLFFWFFLVLFKHNSHSIKLSYFKCTIQWLVIYSQTCATVTTIKFLNTFITPTRNPISPSASRRQPVGLLSP